MPDVKRNRLLLPATLAFSRNYYDVDGTAVVEPSCAAEGVK